MDMNLQKIIIPAVTTLLSASLLFIVRGITFRVLHKWAKKTETDIDDIIIKAFRTPSLYWCIAIGLYIGVVVSDIQEKYVFYLSKTIHVIVILVLGFLIILSVLEISITPFITALGVGGLAVALALQDTLANLFAGIHILIEKTIRVGDFIRLETGQEGYVEDITWRTTRVKMLPNNIVVIPNSKLAQSIVTNYYLPEKRMSLSIPIGVSYSSDPEKVEKILVEEAKKAVGEIPGLIKDPEPFVRFIPGFGESSLDFTLICQVREFVDQYLVQHELRKRIFKRFKKEGIEIPFPQRTVHLKGEKEEQKPD